jgi:formate--tetrahydrofolate ligase
VHEGAANLRKQIENIRAHGVPVVVAINAFTTDHPSEWRAIAEIAGAMNVRVALAKPVTEGGVGVTELAEAVAEATNEPSTFRLLYPDTAPLREKIQAIACQIYGADGVHYESAAARQIDAYEASGYGSMPVCIAKTHLSLSSDPALTGAPTGWTLPVREVRAAVGAGYVYPICGDMRTMPGLGAHPAAHVIDLDARGDVTGLS